MPFQSPSLRADDGFVTGAGAERSTATGAVSRVNGAEDRVACPAAEAAVVTINNKA
jgi:hypothetical protein